MYPDGSGALTYFNQDKIIRDLRAKLSVYSPEQTDIDAIAQNREDGIQPLMLPVFGLARADGNAFVGMIDAGEDVYKRQVRGTPTSFIWRPE